MAKPYSSLTYEDLDTGNYELEELDRLLAAEEVCWGFNIAIASGLLDAIPIEDRADVLAVIGYEKWANLAVETGILPSEADTTYEAGPVPGYMM